MLSRRHHQVLQSPVGAAGAAVDVSRPALHRCDQPGPVHAVRLRRPRASQDEVAELLRLPLLVLERNHLINKWNVSRICCLLVAALLVTSATYPVIPVNQ